MSRSIFLLRGDFKIRVREWLDALRSNGVAYRVTSTKRTWSEQAALYQRFLDGLSTLPAAPPGKSKHQLALAIDVVFDVPGDLEIAVQSAGVHLLRWAGAGDRVHFDSPTGLPCPPC